MRFSSALLAGASLVLSQTAALPTATVITTVSTIYVTPSPVSGSHTTVTATSTIRSTSTVTHPSASASQGFIGSNSHMSNGSSKGISTSHHNSTGLRPTWQQGLVNSNSRFLRGVNIGSWLILEQWMVSDLFNGTDAIDQYTFDKTAGAEAKLQNHWSTYFTQDDVTTLKSYGVNA